MDYASNLNFKEIIKKKNYKCKTIIIKQYFYASKLFQIRIEQKKEMKLKTKENIIFLMGVFGVFSQYKLKILFNTFRRKKSIHRLMNMFTL